MPDLVESSPRATAWMTENLAARENGNVFGRLASSVIWSDATDSNGSLLVPIDPAQLAAEINASPFPLLLGHDPGRPLGKVLAAEVFESPTGEVFVAAVLGLYERIPMLGFHDLGFDTAGDSPSPESLPALPANLRLEIAADPREVDEELLAELTRETPVPIDFQKRSHNAAEAAQTFVAISVLFMALVWNPFVTTLASEASKDAYAALKNWLKKVTARLSERRNPVIEVQSHHGGCCISFMFRGQEVARHYKAHEALHAAAARAAHLLFQMKASSLNPVRLVLT